jgi:hypothetical protein
MKKLLVQDAKRGIEVVRIPEDPSAYWYAIGLTAFIAAMAALPFLLISWN